jgi:lipoyl synthase
VQVGDQRARPAWLRKEKPVTGAVLQNKTRIARLGLHTVCESARCPNLSECMASGNATFLILGDVCTRRCRFCSVRHGVPVEPDPAEGEGIARYIADAGLRYAVITSVTRDDLPDGGSGHFASVITEIRRHHPAVGLEVLTPDFMGRLDAVDRVVDLPLQVFGHNVETVRQLSGRIRCGADHSRSLCVLERAAARAGGRLIVKSGVMVGLGETREELGGLFRELAAAGVSALTMGQYLRPGRDSLPVARYIPPEEFQELAAAARSAGIASVLSGPYVRSSYLAEALYRGQG